MPIPAGTPPHTVVLAQGAATVLPSRIEPTSTAETSPTYHFFLIESAQSFFRFASELGSERLALVLKLNRIDLEHARVGDTLVVPDQTSTEIMFAPFAQRVERLAEIPKLIVVSERVQAFGAYEAGSLVRWGPTSTGRQDMSTPTGLFHTNWKAKETVSTEDERWLLKWYFNFHNSRGISFHQFALPGYPASHACVRLNEDDARWLYSWAEQWVLSADGRSILVHGTPVLIFGDYTFSEDPPWKRLPIDPNAASVTKTELDATLEAHLAVVVERQRLREAFLAQRKAASPVSPVPHSLGKR